MSQATEHTDSSTHSERRDSVLYCGGPPPLSDTTWLSSKSGGGPPQYKTLRRFARFAFAASMVFLLFTGCRTVPPPSVDLSDPAWTVRRGQAVWTSERGAEGIAGELMIATQPDGSSWMQFSKPPFTIMTASRLGNRWHIEFQQGSKRYGGSGEPPARLAWFQLANALSGQPTRAHWEFSRDADGGWLLKHSKRGETLEGYFNP